MKTTKEYYTIIVYKAKEPWHNVSWQKGVKMDYKQNLFYAIKLMYILVILVEGAVLKMIIAPDGFYECFNVNVIFSVYVEHLILSIIILSVGALIFLKKV